MRTGGNNKTWTASAPPDHFRSTARQFCTDRKGGASGQPTAGRLRSVGGATYAAAISNDAAMGSATAAREVTPVVTSVPLTRKPSRHA